jgi:hypothetical protein
MSDGAVDTTAKNEVVFCQVRLKFKTTSGYQSETGFPTDGTRGAILAIQELTRICTLSGDGDRVLEVVRGQIAAVREWQRELHEKQQQQT